MARIRSIKPETILEPAESAPQPTPRRPMRPSLRFEVFQRDGFTCRYCGARSPEAILEVDHVMPLSAGGLDEIENMVTACYACNRGKGARLLSDPPIEPDLHEKAVSIAEHELQVAEYNHWRRKQRDREEGELDQLEREWVARLATYSGAWQRTTARKLLRRLGAVDMEEMMDVAKERAKPYPGRSYALSVWLYFCGCCWNLVTEREGGEPQ